MVCAQCRVHSQAEAGGEVVGKRHPKMRCDAVATGTPAFLPVAVARDRSSDHPEVTQIGTPSIHLESPVRG